MGPEHVGPAVDALLDEARGLIASMTRRSGAPGADEASWNNLVAPLEDIQNRMDRAWSPVGHLNAVMDTPALREAYNAALAKLTTFHTELGQNESLYAAYRSIANSDEYTQLDAPGRKTIDNALRDFKLAGVALEPEAKAEFKANETRLSALSSRFKENVLDATSAWRKLIGDASALDGLPESALQVAAEAAARDGQQGWLLTLDAPCYIAVVTYAGDRTLRREIYEAYVTRASDLGPHAGQFDNSEVMDEILALRHRQALALGYASYAELSLARKMAPSTDEVVRFLRDLAARARPRAQAELEELRDFAHRTDGLDRIEAWDLPYYAEKLRVERYDISQEALRAYFPAPRVIEGLFDVAARLYGVTIKAAGPVQTWHPDVQFFEIHDTDTGELLGRFYLDLYARAHKRGGAWMDECIARQRVDRYWRQRVDACRRQRVDACRRVDDDDAVTLQTPVAYLTCNFTPAVQGRPALLTHDEVTTLFHEFGHGLHHLLTRIDRPAVAGIRGVPWDAVELPSQLMENWCYEREALALFSGHYESGEPLPDATTERLRAGRTFHAALQMLRQIEFALFDFKLHLEYDPPAGARTGQILAGVRDEVAVVPTPEFNRFAHGFSHVFGGGYAAGYYSYKWAEALSSDAFSKFEERGIFDRDTGREFRACVLERGGAEDAMDLFVRFRGREPSIEALLRHSGLSEEPTTAPSGA
ncbi:MAG: M3 family metallopeptidase [Gammaproteobacteria bacterium]